MIDMWNLSTLTVVRSKWNSANYGHRLGLHSDEGGAINQRGGECKEDQH